MVTPLRVGVLERERVRRAALQAVKQRVQTLVICCMDLSELSSCCGWKECAEALLDGETRLPSMPCNFPFVHAPQKDVRLLDMHASEMEHGETAQAPCCHSTCRT